MSKTIKILSGWSNTGGSTEAFINLTNAFNDIGYDATFYGPHLYHLNKCKAGNLREYNMDKDDIVISHFLRLSFRPYAKRVILNCHEKDIFYLPNVARYWDTVVFLNENQQKFHNYFDSHIIPNIRQKFDIIDKGDKELVAGIIGTIDENKQTHISIARALADNCKKIILYGEVRDQVYFHFYIKPLLNDKVVLYGYMQNKQEMYNSIGRVYHSSISEVASLVQDECESTQTKFFGNDATIRNEQKISNEEILKKWVTLFEE